MPNSQSQVSICNMALGHCGRTAAPITNLTSSAEGRICGLWWDAARQETLEMHDWTFARWRVTMALHADDPPAEWAYRYQMPANVLAFRGLWNPFSSMPASPIGVTFNSDIWSPDYGDLSNAIPYSIELSEDGTEETIVTNEGNAIGWFTRDQTSITPWSPLFVGTMAWVLAGKIAYGLTSKQGLADYCLKSAMATLRLGAASNANQEIATPPRDGYSIRARQ